MKLVHGGDLTSYHERFPDRPVLDFSANVNPLGMPEGVRCALAESGAASAHYPDPLCRALSRAIGEFEGVPDGWVLCGNGASDLLWRVPWALRPQRALLLAPTFADYERALLSCGCQVTRHTLRAEKEFRLDATLLEAIPGMDLVILCNPNNPTGTRAPAGLLEQVLEQCERHGAVLAVDECFLDFETGWERHSMKRFLPHAGSLLVVKAFTKLFAMPGVRLGYLLCADKALLTRLAEAGPTWSVSAPAQLCGLAALGETGYLAQTRELIPVWRSRLRAGLDRLGCETWSSRANYLLFRSRPGLAEDLEPHGILLRDCANFAGLAEGYYRTAVRTEAENNILLERLEDLLG